MRIGAYESTGTIHESARSVVSRGVRIDDGLEVVIKSASSQLASAEGFARLRNEWSIARMFDTPAVPRVVELVEGTNDMALVFEAEPTLEALDRRVAARRLSVAQSLRVALGIVDALAEIHAKGVVHKDIKPSNILVDERLSRVALIDFGIATIAPRELNRRAGPSGFEGTPGFLAPEQTGRINRPVDYRSDYYGLGATLYWMLSGAAPFAEFEAFDAMVHAHLTRIPPRLDTLDPELPEVLAKLVAKLLHKDADHRYQGSHGLRADLARCLESLDEAGRIPSFELAQLDPSERLQAPRELHGRASELDQLRARVVAAREAGPQLISLQGPSGAGKSALVDALWASLDPTRTVCVSTKFDQFTPASPHAGAGHMLGSLVNQLIDHEHVVPSLLRARLRDALGPNASLIVELVPAIEQLLGAIEPAPAVGPAEARDRFWDTLERLCDALLLPELEFVVFIDDGQWADRGSLRVIRYLCREPTRALTLILAARSDAPDGADPLSETLAAFEAVGLEATRIVLSPLGLDAIEALVADVLDDADEGPALAALLHRRTGGTPLFVSQLLMTYYAEGIIEIDRGAGRWRVDLDRARGRASSGDVVQFLVHEFERLPPTSRQLLGVAACIGARFEVETLAAASGMPPARVSAALWDAVASGHIQPLSGSGRGAGSSRTRDSGAQRHYAFVHDRVQQVAREALDGDPSRLYLDLARRLVPEAEPEALEAERLHALADYIGHARAQVVAPDERQRFAQVCAHAGERARATAAFASAVRHYEDALSLLDSTDARAEAFALHLALAECRVLVGTLADADADFAAARALAAAETDLPLLMLSRVTLAMVKGQVEQALAGVAEAIELFDLELRIGADQAWLGPRMAAVLARVASLGDAGMLALGDLDDPRQQLINQLLLSATNAAYLGADISLYVGLGLVLIEAGLDHGLADTTGVAFTQLALIVASALGDYEGARRYSTLGRQILDRSPDSPLWGMAEVIQGTTVQPWVEHMAGSIPVLKRAYTRSREAGMFTAAAYAQFMVVVNAFDIGIPLSRVRADARGARTYLESIGDTPLVHALDAHLRALELLEAPALPKPDRGPLVTVDLGDPGSTNPATFFVIHATELMLATLFGEPERASAAIVACQPVIDAGTGMMVWIIFRVLALVHACEAYASLDAEARSAHDAAVAEARASLSSWAQSCPANGQPFVELLDGAWGEAGGELDEARRAYTRAAEAAAASGFHNFEGFACERAAAIWDSLGDPRAALGLLHHARRAYARWGALALAHRVRDQLHARGFGDWSEPTLTHTSKTDTVHGLDAASIVQLTLALSETSQLSETINQLLETSSKNAGADRCVLLLDDDGQLFVRAELVDGQGVHHYAPPLALDQAHDKLATSVVRRCVQRGEALIIDDVQAEPGADPFLVAHDLRALLALPIVHKRERIGVLYLENRVTPGAFTRPHLRVLSTLALQAAVSLDNARLFDALREREARWRALVDSAPDTIMIVDRNHTIALCNRAEGPEGEALVGVELESLVGSADLERVRATIDFVFETGSQASYDSTQVIAGQTRRLTTRLGPIRREETGTIEGVTLISTDVTARYELEQQLRQSQKMQAIGTLAGGVAHDFNNYLMVIMGAADLGALELDALGIEPGSGAHESFEEIISAADRATSLTRQLLAFSRKQILQPKDLDMRELVTNLGRMLERLIGEDIELTLGVGAEPCPVHVDPGQLEQVIMNLVINARDAMPQGGSLEVRAGRVELDSADAAQVPALSAGEYVVLEVRDTGVGMAPELAARIFEPFFTTKAPDRGTGLGLSTVHGIIEQSGGHIEVESRPGAGACFRIYLPAQTERGVSETKAEHPASVAAGRGETILVVEDDVAVAALISQVLEARGYVVEVATNRDEALAAAEACPRVDLVLADVVLPDVNGRLVAEAIEALHPGVPVLYTSGYTDEIISRHGVDPAEAAFLQKPFMPSVLSREVRRVLDERAGD